MVWVGRRQAGIWAMTSNLCSRYTLLASHCLLQAAEVRGRVKESACVVCLLCLLAAAGGGLQDRRLSLHLPSAFRSMYGHGALVARSRLDGMGWKARERNGLSSDPDPPSSLHIRGAKVVEAHVPSDGGQFTVLPCSTST